MADTFVDGCGVVADASIGKGTRIRFQLENNRQQDVTVYVENGELHVLGMYRPLVMKYVTPNHLIVGTQHWRNSHGA